MRRRYNDFGKLVPSFPYLSTTHAQSLSSSWSQAAAVAMSNLRSSVPYGYTGVQHGAYSGGYGTTLPGQGFSSLGLKSAHHQMAPTSSVGFSHAPHSSSLSTVF
ncbi:hypothetical protein LSAT2_024150 [Lamellibrachia satsuma]|nr:hypothetical protein LSAT2_024150 [Lamellibrachia satsuma]